MIYWQHKNKIKEISAGDSQTSLNITPFKWQSRHDTAQHPPSSSAQPRLQLYNDVDLFTGSDT